MVERNPAALCRLLGVSSVEAPQILSAELPIATLSADLLLRVSDDHMGHVEYMRTTASDLVARMLVYRGLILNKYPDHRVTQYVLVLGGGQIKGHDDLSGLGFALDLRIIYARDVDPSVFLNGPDLAALAVLGRGTTYERAKAYSTAITLIREHAGPDTAGLLEFAGLMAAITLDSSIVRQIVEEAAMTREEANLTLERLTEEFGETALVRSAREESHTSARTEVLAAMLRERFGDEPDVAAVAERLASWADTAAAVHAISTAETLDKIPTTLASL
jgi:hypothetical protein